MARVSGIFEGYKAGFRKFERGWGRGMSIVVCAVCVSMLVGSGLTAESRRRICAVWMMK